MNELDKEIAFYDAMQAELESRHTGEWVVIHGAALVNVFPTFEEAADAAVREFGRGPYLIRQVGAAPVGVPGIRRLQSSALQPFRRPSDHSK